MMMSNADWDVLDKRILGMIRLSLLSLIAFNISKEETTKDLMATLSQMYEKTISIQQGVFYEDVIEYEDG